MNNPSKNCIWDAHQNISHPLLTSNNVRYETSRPRNHQNGLNHIQVDHHLALGLCKIIGPLAVKQKKPPWDRALVEIQVATNIAPVDPIALC